MKPEELVDLLRIALQLTQKISDIAKNDPTVWEQIKDDYNAAAEAFKNATDT